MAISDSARLAAIGLNGHGSDEVEAAIQAAIDTETADMRIVLECVWAGVPDAVRKIAANTDRYGVQQIPILTGTVEKIRIALGKAKP